MTRAALGTVFFLLASALLAPAFADDLDYSVTNAAPANVKVAGDGIVFVDYTNPAPGARFQFTLNIWVESGKAAAPFPTPAVPIDVRKLSGVDASSWFTVAPSAVSFSGYGKDPSPRAGAAGYTGIPGGSFRSVNVTLTVPAGGVPGGMVQVRIKARAARVRCLGEAHGVIVRLATVPPIGGGGGGVATGLALRSWLSDAAFVPLSDPQYNDAFRVLRQTGTQTVAGTVPGGFVLNVLATTSARIPCLRLTVPPLPADFSLSGAGALHAYVGGTEVALAASNGPTPPCGPRPLTFEFRDVPPGVSVNLTIGLRYSLATLPSTTYLPRLYTFSATATAGCTTLRTASSATGTLDLGTGGGDSDGGGGALGL
ncbi:MAG: hypothetical protein HYZ53_22925 [Planctomycetes bacterium]|nr:hypothetical protein [Planctomycetota bacterium]